VEPPTPAADFEIEELGAGRTAALSEFHGSWVLLTFFATWCGPCRSEMPSLQMLHQSLGGAGLAVVAVSVDATKETVPPFVEKLGLTFPVLWDERGTAGSTYYATSIPVSYLINPEGLITGVARGARDWASMSALFTDLFAAQPPGSSLPNQYVADTTNVELPQSIEPPTAEVSLRSQAPLLVGKPFQVVVRLVWAGSFEQYVPQLPHMLLPENIEQTAATASTSSTEGSSVVTYVFTLVARSPGSFALDPVELRYLPHGEPEPVTSRLIGPTVTIRRRTVLGLRPLVFAAVLGGAALVVGVALIGARRASRQRRTRLSTRDSSYDRLKRGFERARSHRLEGDLSSCVLVLAELARELGLEQDSSSQELAQLVEAARYSGKAPPQAAIERLQRDVELALQDLRPDAEGQEREMIQFASSEDAEPHAGSP